VTVYVTISPATLVVGTKVAPIFILVLSVLSIPLMTILLVAPAKPVYL